MNKDPLGTLSLDKITTFQRGEITEHRIYTMIAGSVSDSHNREVLSRIASQEYEHYLIWKKYTSRDVAPDVLRVWFYYLLARVLGITFSIKLMEGIEKRAQLVYHDLGTIIPEVKEILAHEEAHERELIGLLDEERLHYVGSVVLGLNDALVEFTGSLAGLTFAIQNSQVIAIAGLIMGVAASLSMAASEYLSQKSESGSKNPLKASLYTGITYLMTVALLILPFLLLSNPYIALPLTLGAAVLVIFLFTFYISVAKDLPFIRRFGEMVAISMGIAGISFVIGIIIRLVLHVDV
ncbi:MAG: VIT1/CCC1 transporter family protein [Methanoregula sp.]|nr:MAG: VIT1/CCC1 transporter family protein [Methanoregula sp.]